MDYFYSEIFAGYSGETVCVGTEKICQKISCLRGVFLHHARARCIAKFYSADIIRFITAPRPIPLTSAPPASGYRYMATDTKHGFSAYIGQAKTNVPEVQADFGSIANVNFVLTDLAQTISQPNKSGNEVSFKNVRTNVDLSYETLTNGIKESIIVKAPTPGNAFTFAVNAIGATPHQLAPNSYGSVFYDAQGKYVFNFAKPFAIDAKGARTDAAILGIHKASDSDTAYLATIIVNQKWLSDPARVYPITIDPTITYNTSSLFSSGYVRHFYRHL